MKKIVLLMMMFALFATACSPSSETTETAPTEDAQGASSDSTETEADEDTLVVGLEATYPPFNWTQLNDANGAVQIEGTREYAGGYESALRTVSEKNSSYARWNGKGWNPRSAPG